MFVDSLIAYIGPPNILFTIQCGVVIKLEDVVHPFFFNCVVMVFALSSSSKHIPINCRCRIKKSNRSTSTYLIGLATSKTLAVLFNMVGWLNFPQKSPVGQCDMCVSSLISTQVYQSIAIVMFSRMKSLCIDGAMILIRNTRLMNVIQEVTKILVC